MVAQFPASGYTDHAGCEAMITLIARASVAVGHLCGLHP